MRLAVSTAAAPSLPLAELLAGCRGRGVEMVELLLDRAAPVDDARECEALAARVREVFAESGVAVVALAPAEGSEIAGALRLARALEVPAVVGSGCASASGGSAFDHSREMLLREHLAGGGTVLLLHGTDPVAAAAAGAAAERLGAGVGLAWEVDPPEDDPSLIPVVLEAAGEALRYVRLRGGGPEAAAQTGLGVGTLMGRLALARYSGPLVLTPSTPSYHRAWLTWLTRSGGWGCGSKQSDPDLVRLLDVPNHRTRESA